MGDRHFHFEAGSQYVEHIETQNFTFNIDKVESMNVDSPSPRSPGVGEPLTQEGRTNDEKQFRSFGLMMRSGHSPVQIEQAMEKLRIMCAGKNSRALMRTLVALDNEGYIQLEDIKASELFKELEAAFPIPYITPTAFAESYRLIG